MQRAPRGLQSWEPSIPQRAPNRPLRSGAPLGGPPRQTQPPPGQTWEPQTATQPELEEAPLTKRQLKCRKNEDSKLAKEFKRLESDIDNLKSQMGALKHRISKASKSTNARFKRKKIRSMKREAEKINEKLAESEAKLELIEQRVPMDLIRGAPLKLHPPNRSKRIEAKIAELNKKVRRARHKKNKE